MAIGDHVRVFRGAYWHHGIETADGRVIHFTGEPLAAQNAAIRETSIHLFILGGELEIVAYAERDHVDVTVERARSRLGERGYDLIRNNCEHFARWCVTGVADSQQVRNAGAVAGGTIGTAAAATAGLGVVSATGAVAGLSGAGVMSGLAATGAVVGGGAVAGLGILAAVPGAIGTIAMGHALRDDPNLHQGERDSRAMGRAAATAGAVGGTAAAIGTVAAVGVPGLSAVGITSGLAAVGGAVGGGMAAGVAMTVAAPAVAAAAVGYGVYRFFRWVRS